MYILNSSLYVKQNKIIENNINETRRFVGNFVHQNIPPTCKLPLQALLNLTSHRVMLKLISF